MFKFAVIGIGLWCWLSIIKTTLNFFRFVCCSDYWKDYDTYDDYDI